MVSSNKSADLLELSSFASGQTLNLRPADSLAENEEANTNCGTLSALETDAKLATGGVAFGSLGKAALPPKPNMGGATFNCSGGADLSDVKVDSVTGTAGWAAMLVKVVLGKAKPVPFSATTGPTEDAKS